jgi:hypothetical protein
MCLASDATNRVAGVGHLIDQRHPGGRTDNRLRAERGDAPASASHARPRPCCCGLGPAGSSWQGLTGARSRRLGVYNGCGHSVGDLG